MADWVRIGTKIECRRLLSIRNPLYDRDFEVRPGRMVEILDIFSHIRVGWFDFGNGLRNGYIDVHPIDFEHYFRPVEVAPVRVRPKIGMIVNFCPDNPGRQGRYIGYWATSIDPDADRYAQKGCPLPWPEDFVDPSWDAKERNLVIAHLRSAPDVEFWRGFSLCRICKTAQGSTDKSDGHYVWPAGLAHYIEEHNVKPPLEFIEHVRKRSA